MPNTESIKNKNKQIIINNDNVEIENMDEPIKKKNLVFNTLSPTLVSSISNDSQKIILNYKNSNEFDKIKTNDDNNNSTPIIDRPSIPEKIINDTMLNSDNINNINSNNETSGINNNTQNKIEYTDQMKNYEHFDNNVENFDNVNINKGTNINNEKLLIYNNLVKKHEINDNNNNNPINIPQNEQIINFENDLTQNENKMDEKEGNYNNEVMNENPEKINAMKNIFYYQTQII